jgi:uncharacterized protein (TIGR02271 family)
LENEMTLEDEERARAQVEPKRQRSLENDRDTSVIRHEEEPLVETTSAQIGAVRVRKGVETYTAAEVVPREIEQADVERSPAREADSGEIETLPDGSVSIPVFEERLVVTKERFVRERIVVRKDTVTEEERVELELKRERVQVSAEEGARDEEIVRAVGREVRDRDGEKIGTVDVLFRDDETGEPAWMGVQTGILRTRRFLVPLGGVQVAPDAVRLPWSKELVEGAPSYDEEDDRGLIGGDQTAIVITPEKEQRAYAHYGVQPVRTVEEGGKARFRAWRLDSERPRE